MFQKSSGNAQARAARKAAFSRANEHGIDRTAFKETDVGSYQAFVEKKRKLELQIADIKARISKASSNKYTNVKLVDRTVRCDPVVDRLRQQLFCKLRKVRACFPNPSKSATCIPLYTRSASSGMCP
jgi:hypothetical protein